MPGAFVLPFGKDGIEQNKSASHVFAIAKDFLGDIEPTQTSLTSYSTNPI